MFLFVETANEYTTCVPMHLNLTSITMSKWRRYYIKIRQFTPTSNNVSST